MWQKVSNIYNMYYFSGGINELYKYESERQLHNISVMGTIDSLYRLYSTTATPLVLLRSLGLSTINSLGTLKVNLIFFYLL